MSTTQVTTHPISTADALQFLCRVQRRLLDAKEFTAFTITQICFMDVLEECKRPKSAEVL